jgi:serine acetyltransferase
MSKLFIIGAGGFGKEVASDSLHNFVSVGVGASIISKIYIQSGTEIAANQVISCI